MKRNLHPVKGFAALLAAVVVCYAQAQPPGNQQNPAPAAGQGTFFGQLTGAGLDGATVTLTNVATGAAQTVVTDQNGNFTVNNLAPGSYRVSVHLKSGLQTPDQTIEINSSNQVQLSFAPNAASPTAGALTVQARSPTLQRNSAEVSRSYDSITIRELPLLDRVNEELVPLMPGISPPVLAADRITDPQRSREFNVNGQPAFANLFNQDGTYDNEPFSARPLRIEPDEAVQSLNVLTSNYNAEYGISAGDWASTLTRPGTNNIHGSLFEFNTNNYFTVGRALYSSVNTPRFDINQVGGTAGGPLVPDVLFWFASYEGFLQRGDQAQEATVPTAALASGNFSGVSGATIFNPLSGSTIGRSVFPNNTIPSAFINPTSAQILSLIPSPNLPGVTNNLVGAARLTDDTHRLDGKIDERYSDRLSGFLRYGFTEANVNQGSILGAVGNPLQSDFRAMNAVASLSYSLRTNLMTEISVGYDRYRNDILPWGNVSSLGTLNSIIFPSGFPSINIAGFSPLGEPVNVPSKQIDNIYDGEDQWVAHTGINSLKFGVSIRSLQTNGITNPFFSSLGSFTFGPGATLASTASAAALTPATLQANALAGFLTGTPNVAGISTYPLTPTYRQMQYGAYIVDTVNLYKRLYLELGVRYDIFSPIQPAVAGGGVLYNSTTNTTELLGENHLSPNITRYDLNNVAPRVGLAFSPTSRFVFRAGYGILYFAEPFAMAPYNPVSQGVQSGIAGGLGTTTFTLPTVPTASATTAANTPYYVSPRNFPTPYLETYSGMVQGDLGNGFLLDIGYVGNVGRQLPYSVPLAGLPGQGLSGLPVAGRTANIVEIAPGLTSNYNSMQVNLTKKFGAGLAFSGAYTYSKALDYGFNLLDPFSRAANYGPADWDRTNILSISHVWRLPFGVSQRYFTHGFAARLLGDWEINGIYRWATGAPYSVTADPLACACLGVASVPAVFTGTTVPSGATFNPNSFSIPAAGTFGSSISRNGFRGPSMSMYNMAVFRNFAVNENIRLELRGEVYNLTNSTNPMNPVTSLGAPGFGTSLGNIDGLAGRQFQLAGRVLF